MLWTKQAVPRDINELPFVVQSDQTDIRTLDKLYDGINTSFLDDHMWLAPFLIDRANFIFVFLDEPITISRIVVYNYTKTSTRGVKELEILVDDVIVYRGQLRKAKSEVETRRNAVESSLTSPSSIQCPNNGNAILFTLDQDVVQEEMRLGRIYNPAEEDDSHCLFINNGQVDETQAPNKKNGSLLPARPMTSARSTRRSRQESGGSGTSGGCGSRRKKEIQDNIGEL